MSLDYAELGRRIGNNIRNLSGNDKKELTDAYVSALLAIHTTPERYSKMFDKWVEMQIDYFLTLLGAEELKTLNLQSKRMIVEQIGEKLA